MDLFEYQAKELFAKHNVPTTPGRVRVLTLNETQVTDLAPLQGLTGLQQIYLDGTGVDDLTPLANHTEMRAIWLDGTPVTDLRPVLGWKDLGESVFDPLRF